MEQLNPVEKDIIRIVSSYLQKNPDAFGGLGQQRFTSITSIQPTAPTMMPGGVGWKQMPFIGGVLAPAVPSGRDMRLVWAEYGDYALVVDDDTVAFNGDVKPADASMTLHTESVKAHGRSVTIGNDEARVAAASGINLVAIKSGIPKRLVDLRREVLTATFFQTLSNYFDATHYETLAGTDQWSHKDSDPITKLRSYSRVVRAACGAKPNYLGLGYTAAEGLCWNESILALLKTANTLGNGIPVTLQVVATLLNTNVVAGEAIYKDQPGGSSIDVWGDNAHLVYVGGAGLEDPKFAMTAESPDYPKVVPMTSDKGLEGGQKLNYGDVYKTYSCWKTAGAALFDCTA